MRRFPLRLATAATLALIQPSPAHAAYRRVKVGPFEMVPTLAVEVRQHSNVYVSNDDVKAANATSTSDVSGLIIDVRPGLSILAKPDLEHRIRGLFFDFRYSPGISFFPSAPPIEIPCVSEGCESQSVDPDKIKFVHNLVSNLRYQVSPRFNLSAGIEYSNPELSQADVTLTDFTAHVGTKVDFSANMALDLGGLYKRFTTPLSHLQEGVNEPLGSFTSYQGLAHYQWAWTPTLDVGVRVDYEQRTFDSLEVFDRIQHNDFNGDGVPDIGKDYDQATAHATFHKRLARQARGTIEAGYTWRNEAERQFGSQNYNGFTGLATIETLLTKRTRLQVSAERTITDTVREITFAEFNAFTTDQLGQFSVVPAQFAADRNHRFMVDFIQNVFKRGDQILLGGAYQIDNLKDQQGLQNFFVPGSSVKRELTDVCEVPASDGVNHGAQFCQTVLADQQNRLFLVTAGYRIRVMNWLGLQLRYTWFHETAESLPSPEAILAGAQPKTVPTNYWSLAGGMVINLHVFQ